MTVVVCLGVLLASLIDTTSACMATPPTTTPSTPSPTVAPTPGPALCLTCNPALVMLTTAGAGAHDFETDVTVTTSGCAVRTLTCTGNNAIIEMNGGDVGTLPGDGMTATIELMCNDDGTAWEYTGIPITQLECSSEPPAAPCETCDPALVMTAPVKPVSHNFATDMPAIVNGCAVRTLTCTGTNPYIEVNGGADPTVPGGATTATYELTCNADGTAWEDNVGTPITQLECAEPPPCQNCDPALVMTAPVKPVSHNFATDMPAIVNGCAVRTLTCTGTNPYIEVNGGALATVPGNGATATYMLMCNAAGTGWENNGMPITQLECAEPPPCQNCDPALVMTAPVKPVSHNFATDMPAIVNGCAVRTLTCTGTNPYIEVNGGAVATVPGNGATATYMLMCNAAGTGWVNNAGTPITQLECAEPPPIPPCQTCDQALLVKTTNSAASHAFFSDVTVLKNGCSARTLTCKGTNANIEINMAAGVIPGDGMTAVLEVTCNAAGTAWENTGLAVVDAECSSG